MAELFHVPGPCTVSWGGASLGSTKTGITIMSRTHFVPIIDDTHGATPADWIRAGRSVTVSIALNDPASIKAASPFVGKLFSNSTGTGTEIGKLAFTGDPAGTFIAKELIITERNGTDLWKAKYALPTDPEALPLVATQELILPLAFLISPDENNDLFYTLPSYLT